MIHGSPIAAVKYRNAGFRRNKHLVERGGEPIGVCTRGVQDGAVCEVFLTPREMWGYGQEASDRDMECRVYAVERKVSRSA